MNQALELQREMKCTRYYWLSQMYTHPYIHDIPIKCVVMKYICDCFTITLDRRRVGRERGIY